MTNDEYNEAFDSGLDAAIEALAEFEMSDGWIESRFAELRAAIGMARKSGMEAK